MKKRSFHEWWPILVLVVLETLLFVTNFTPNTYVVGWDNMFPEFNFSSNFTRTLSSVWQEYRGLGLTDGMSHAANLVHYCLIWLFSLILPQQLLRYVYIFLTHLVGGIGMYMLLRYLTKNHRAGTFLSLIGALVYQYCFATVQMYYLPFEVFVTHFAALPWLIYTAINLLDHPTKRHMLMFALVSFLSTPQAHVPTVFIVYCMIITIILMGSLITSRMKTLKTSLVIIAITFFINAFWGIPFTYATLHGSQTITESKNNQISTEDTFQKNRAFGDITNVALMNSFSIQYMQYDFTTSSVNFMLLPWITHNASPVVSIAKWTLFLLAIIGVIGAGFTAMPWFGITAVIYILSILFIGNDIPIIKPAVDALRSHIPLFGDIFRFVFTKFFIVFAFSTALMVVSGVITIGNLITKRKKLAASVSVGIVTIALLGVTTIPSFTGNFLFKNLRVAIPQEYFDVFSFFQKQPENERILIYPMPWFWAWTQYRWGVIGSGFTWFGIPQPTIDRAFDPWSDKNENVYWEFMQAIYESNAVKTHAILLKYNIHWILVDEHIIHAVNDKALYMAQFEHVVQTIPEIQKVQQFGRISLYKVEDATSEVTIADNVANIGPAYQFTDNDTASLMALPYQTTDTKAYDVTIPFRTMFTGRDQRERTFSVQTTPTSITLNTTVSLPLTKTDVVYDSDTSSPFGQAPRSCDPLRTTRFTRTSTREQNISFERLSSYDASNCFDIFLSSISHRNGYLLEVTTRHITGRRLSVSITNKDTKRTFMETFVTGNQTVDNTWQTSYFTIPPMDTYGMGYTFTFDNLAIGRSETINDISRIRVITIPYTQLVGQLMQQNPLPKSMVSPLTSVHPNPAYYRVAIDQSIANQTLILSQAYDTGWHAYSKRSENIPDWAFTFAPFIFGKPLPNHVLINNWANGWDVDAVQANQTIIIFFVPQLLEWIGFLLIPVPFLFIIKKRS